MIARVPRAAATAHPSSEETSALHLDCCRSPKVEGKGKTLVLLIPEYDCFVGKAGAACHQEKEAIIIMDMREDVSMSRNAFTTNANENDALLSGKLLVPLIMWLIFFLLAVLGGLLSG